MIARTSKDISKEKTGEDRSAIFSLLCQTALQVGKEEKRIMYEDSWSRQTVSSYLWIDLSRRCLATNAETPLPSSLIKVRWQQRVEWFAVAKYGHLREIAIKTHCFFWAPGLSWNYQQVYIGFDLGKTKQKAMEDQQKVSLFTVQRNQQLNLFFPSFFTYRIVILPNQIGLGKKNRSEAIYFLPLLYLGPWQVVKQNCWA